MAALALTVVLVPKEVLAHPANQVRTEVQVQQVSRGQPVNQVRTVVLVPKEVLAHPANQVRTEVQVQQVSRGQLVNQGQQVRLAFAKHP